MDPDTAQDDVDDGSSAFVTPSAELDRQLPDLRSPLSASMLPPTEPSVAALEARIADLTSQVTSLNAKLVRSFDRIGDLEDDLHEKGRNDSRVQAHVAELERDKTTWEAEMEGGGWVERVSVAHLDPSLTGPEPRPG